MQGCIQDSGLGGRGGGGGGIELPKILRGQGNVYRCTESCTIVSSAMWGGGGGVL